MTAIAGVCSGLATSAGEQGPGAPKLTGTGPNAHGCRPGSRVARSLRPAMTGRKPLRIRRASRSSTSSWADRRHFQAGWAAHSTRKNRAIRRTDREVGRYRLCSPSQTEPPLSPRNSSRARWVRPSRFRASRRRSWKDAPWARGSYPRNRMIPGTNRTAGSVRPFSQLMTVHWSAPIRRAATFWVIPRSVRRFRRCSPKETGAVG